MMSHHVDMLRDGLCKRVIGGVDRSVRFTASLTLTSIHMAYQSPALTIFGTVSQLTGQDFDAPLYGGPIGGCSNYRYQFFQDGASPGNPAKLICASKDLIINGLEAGGRFYYDLD